MILNSKKQRLKVREGCVDLLVVEFSLRILKRGNTPNKVIVSESDESPVHFKCRLLTWGGGCRLIPNIYLFLSCKEFIKLLTIKGGFSVNSLCQMDI